MKIRTEADLIRLCDTKQESRRLEFKRSIALLGKRPDWTEEVAGFATVEGGTLVFGIIEDEETHEASDIDSGLTPLECSKERIENLVDGNISPRLDPSPEVFAVELASKAPGRYAYVVEVPEGKKPPYMVNYRKRYYRRGNFKSESMEDDLVRLFMFRQQSPVLRLRWWKENPSPDTTFLRFALKNEGKVAAEDIYFEVAISAGALHPRTVFPEIPPYFQVRTAKVGDDDVRIFSCTQTHAPSRGGNIGHRLPRLIYPDMDLEVKDFVIGLKTRIGPGAVMRNRLYARNMEMVETDEPLANVTEPRDG